MARVARYKHRATFPNIGRPGSPPSRPHRTRKFLDVHHSALPAPAGELIPPALRALDKAATLVLGGVHMSDIPSFPYDLLYHERVIRSVVNNTREDGKDFLKLAASIPVRTKVEVYSLSDANRALQSLKNEYVRGAAVLTIG